MAEWKRTQDETPKTDGEYIVGWLDGVVTTLWYALDLSKVDFWFSSRKCAGWYIPDGGDGACEVDDPDFWQPLPEPPKEGVNNG